MQVFDSLKFSHADKLELAAMDASSKFAKWGGEVFYTRARLWNRKEAPGPCTNVYFLTNFIPSHSDVANNRLRSNTFAVGGFSLKAR